MIKYYLARLILWAVNVVQTRRNSDSKLVTNVMTNYSTILNTSKFEKKVDESMKGINFIYKSSDEDDELIW